MDSEATLKSFFDPNFDAPWQIRHRWEACLEMLKSMEVRCSHIFREGNIHADIVSNIALLHPQFQFKWWCGSIPEIQKTVIDDRIGRTQYRFCCFYCIFFSF